MMLSVRNTVFRFIKIGPVRAQSFQSLTWKASGYRYL